MASEIEVGDVLEGVNASGEAAPQEVVATFGSVQPCLRIQHEAGMFVCSESHELVTSEGNTVTAQNIDMSREQLRSAEGGPVQIVSIQAAGEHRVYGWTCTPDHVYLAAGILHHNKSTIASTIASIGLLLRINAAKAAREEDDSTPRGSSKSGDSS